MKSPIIISEPGDVMIFESVEEAQAYIDWQDVENDEYVGYDREGRVLNLRVAKIPVKILFFTLHNREVVIEDSEPEQKRPSELRNLLSNYLSYPKFGISNGWLTDAPLDDLITKALEIQRS